MAKFFENVFFPTLKKYDIKDVYHLGDFCDRRKFISFGTAQWIYRTYREPMKKLGVTETVLVGNHDIWLKSSCSINSINELYRDDESVTVVSAPVSIDLDGFECLCLPWICDSNRDDSMRMISDSKARIVLGHLEMSGFSMYRGVVNTEGLNADLFDKFFTVLSGHFHHKSDLARCIISAPPIR